MGRQFNGIDQYFDLGTFAGLNITGDKTIAVWVKQPTAGAGRIFDAYNDDIEAGWFLDTDSGDPSKPIFQQNNADTQPSPVHSFSTGAWVHVAVVVESSGISLYINGVLDTTWSTFGMTSAGTTLSKYIAQGNPNGDLFEGCLADLAIWGTPDSGAGGSTPALTAGQILNLYNGTLRPGQINPGYLRCWYKMEEAAASDNAVDSGTGGHTGTQHGNPPTCTGPLEGTNGAPIQPRLMWQLGLLFVRRWARR